MNRYFGLHTLEGEWHSLLPRYLLLSDRVKNKRILDIGCGTGIGASLLLELGAQMVDAIDHRPAVLELGRMKHAKQDLDFHVMFWEELDFPDDTFDVVVCLDPASPVTDPSLIAEVQRVLKDGGEYICAVEVKQIDGMESVLPRYGYTDAAESIDVHQASDRVPQLGELDARWDHVSRIVQKSVLAHVFDVPDPQPTDSVRKVDDDGVNGVWSEPSPDAPQGDQGRWIPVDMRLSSHDTDAGSVEIYFCGNGDVAAPPLREIHLPFYSIVTRLQQVIGDLQTLGVRDGDDESIFDEVVDDASLEEESDVVERHPTNEFKAVSWDDEKTGVRARPDLSQYRPANDEVDDLHAKVVELTDLYGQVKNDFQRVVSDASRALDERDQYIEHLVTRIHDWEVRYFDDGAHPISGGGSLDEPTSAYVPAQQSGRVGELETELARLRDEQRRLKAELDAKQALANADDLADEPDESPSSSEEE